MAKSEVKGHTNSKGNTYYLKVKGHLKFFSKDPEGAVEIPYDDYEIKEGKTGMLILKKKEK